MEETTIIRQDVAQADPRHALLVAAVPVPEIDSINSFPKRTECWFPNVSFVDSYKQSLKLQIHRFEWSSYPLLHVPCPSLQALYLAKSFLLSTKKKSLDSIGVPTTCVRDSLLLDQSPICVGLHERFYEWLWKWRWDFDEPKHSRLVLSSWKAVSVQPFPHISMGIRRLRISIIETRYKWEHEET